MPGDNYPPGMSRRDLDHVEGIVRCVDCGAELPEEYDGVPWDGDTCPGGCYDEGDDLLDAARDREMEAADPDQPGRWDY